MKGGAFLLSFLCTAVFSSCCLFNQDVPPTQIVKKYGRSEDGSQFLQIDDITLHYRDQGQGPVLVALHGICDSLHTWEGWHQVLKNEFRLIRLDLPGFGLTGMVPDQYYNHAGYIMVLEKFLAALNVKEFVLVGNSLGGYFSWQFALDHPDMVKKLILIDPAAYPLDPPWIVKMADSAILSSLFYHLTPRFLTRSVVESVFGDPAKMTEEDVGRFHDIMLMENNRRAYIEVFKQILKLSAEWPEGISSLDMPVLLMWGSKDRWINPDQIALWKKDLPSIHVLVYHGVGHTPQLEIPIRSAQDAREFMLAP